jgi:hypothetical protein
MNMAIPPRKEICLPVAQWPQAEKSMYLKAIIYYYYYVKCAKIALQTKLFYYSQDYVTVI